MLTKYRTWIYSFLLAVMPNAVQAQGIVTSIAGNGITQYIGDGYPATAYSLGDPSGICMDKRGDLIISEFAGQRLRRLRHDTLSTIGGNSTAITGGDGGPVAMATFNYPTGVVSDTAGNLYVTEFVGDVVRKIDATTGAISTVCGTGSGGFSGDGGPAIAATLETPGGAVVDLQGNIYIPDFGNQRIRKVTAATGHITTIAGTGTAGYSGDGGIASAAQISYPNALCLDVHGDLYFSDYGNRVIRKIDVSTGIITTVAGTGTLGYTGDGGPATLATLGATNGLCTDGAGTLYISDRGNNVIRAVNTEGKIFTIAGNGYYGYSGDGSFATYATFNQPHGVFVDNLGYLYICDGGNSVIRKVSPGITAVTNVNNGPFLRLYPNPSAGKMHFDTQDQTQVAIYDMAGREIFYQDFSVGDNLIDITGTGAGVYICKIIAGGTTQTIKLMKY